MGSLVVVSVAICSLYGSEAIIIGVKHLIWV